MLHQRKHLLFVVVSVVGELLLRHLLGQRRQSAGVKGKVPFRCYQLLDVPLMAVEEKVKGTQYLQKVLQRICRDRLKVIPKFLFPGYGLAHGYEDIPCKFPVHRHRGNGADNKLHVVLFHPEQAEKQEGIRHVVADGILILKDVRLLQNGKVRLELAVMEQALKYAVPVKPHRQTRQRCQHLRHVCVVHTPASIFSAYFIINAIILQYAKTWTCYNDTIKKAVGALWSWKKSINFWKAAD